MRFVAVLATIMALIGTVLPGQAVSAQLQMKMRADFDLGAQWRVNSVARLMAGLPPMHPAHMEVAKTEVWKAHAAAMQTALRQVQADRVATMASWRDATLSRDCPVGKTLLYPFAGPDFFNAWWLFPGCETFVLFGLEHIGEVPNIESMSPRQVERLLGNVRAATGDFFDRNYFITENMTRQLHTAQLQGVVPLMMISMAQSGLDILRIVPFNLPPAATVPAITGEPGMTPVSFKRAPRVLRQLKGVTIEFTVPGSGVVRRVYYFSCDATDTGLMHNPEFAAYLRRLAPTTTFIKSASYLLHSKDFSMLRDTLLDVSGYLVQDDSGLPYATLTARGWNMQLHGRYDVPIPPFQRAFQPALFKAYGEQKPERLPFTFGYQYHDYRDERSNVMVGRSPASDPRNDPRGPGGMQGVALRASGPLGR